MTDVHGEPQQGGYLPAEIWHAYMSAVTEGKACVPFPPPKESISYQPFFGKFATTGRTESIPGIESFEPSESATKGHARRHGQGGAPNNEALGRHFGGSGGAPNTSGPPAPRTTTPVTPTRPPATGQPGESATGGAAPG